MEKNNGKIIAIVALVVAVVALSVGFAAFADQLTIAGSATAKAGTNPFDDTTENGNLDYLSTSPECHATNDETYTEYTPGTASGDAWSGISVELTKAHPSVTCTAKVQNNTAYTAYLRGITTSGPLACSSTGSNKDTNAANVCSTLNMTVKFGTVENDKIEFTGTSTPSANNSTTGSIAAKSGQTPGESTVTLTISYNSSAVTDEDVTITIPTITHNYSSASGTGN